MVEPAAVDKKFRKAWMPFFCTVDKGVADLDSFRAVAGGLTPFLAEVSLPSVSSDVLCETAPKKPAWMVADGGNSRPCLLPGLIG